MDILEEFTDDVNEINISYKNILGTLDFNRFTKLTKLNCSNNNITHLPKILPTNLKILNISRNKIHILPKL